MTARFRLLVIVSLIVTAGIAALAFGSGDDALSNASGSPAATSPGQTTTSSTVGGAVADPVSVCAASIPDEVVSLIRELRAQVICRAAATAQAGHIETTNRRVVIEARPGLSPTHYADTAASLAHQLDLEGRGRLS